jgi:Fe(3+) dicitrate transport protein
MDKLKRHMCFWLPCLTMLVTATETKAQQAAPQPTAAAQAETNTQQAEPQPSSTAAAEASPTTPPSATAVILIPQVDVVGSRDEMKDIPGSATIIDQETLKESRVFDVQEALRKAPGVNVRSEEGFGLRPNIGIRGLNPTRSTKVTLLEDGVPLAYAPYGDNASYYHPPIERYDHIEVLKGVKQLFFGPQTISGVINYITPAPPENFSGFASIAGGSRNFFDSKFRVGGKGLLLDYTHKQGDGARNNISSDLDDINLKWVHMFSDTHGVTLRANRFTEDSTVTYSGLTQAEFTNFGARYNPFKNDEFEIERYGASVTHEIEFAASTQLITNFYYSYFDRDWWRQQSTTTDGQCGADFTADRIAGVRVDPDLCNSIQGRLRSYHTGGFEPRLRIGWTVWGFEHEFEAGFKAHFESQDRRQLNATSPQARKGTLVEKNLRRTDAFSWFMANSFLLGPVTIMPVLRYEHIDSSRTNRLTNVKGSDTLNEVIPGIGIIYAPLTWLTLFTDVHRGFAPPRTEDIIDGAGGSTDVGAEDSINFEIGVRAEPFSSVTLQATYFRNEFNRLIAVGSIAGGSTPLAEGKALFEGLELSGFAGLPLGFYFQMALTWLPTAEQQRPFRRVVGGEIVAGSKAGNRQPYAPEVLFTGALGYHWRDLNIQFEVVHVGSQFADFANTRTPTANGQAGEIDSHTILNLAINYFIRPLNTTAFVTLKNLADETYITDRTRGIQVGMPRFVFGGVTYEW